MSDATTRIEATGEEMTPDLLKNTPSNIARLEDVIEHSQGRKKYLAQTRSPSDSNDVRWYFCKVPLANNELAASVPRNEVVGKGEYFRFGMRDSLAIEASFLQREEELLAYWWREYAECSEGPTLQVTNKGSKNILSPGISQISEQFSVEEERVGVPVKGGLYEVDLSRRHCFPVYWNGENRRVLRGHWFARKKALDWLPLRENIAEQLEMAYRKRVRSPHGPFNIWHRRTFQSSGLFAARFELHGSTPGLHALFTGEDDTWEAWLNVENSGFSVVASVGQNATKLRRGFSLSPAGKQTQDELRQQKEEEMDDYCSQVPVGHVVFMVHGIGQRLEKSNLVDDVTTFRHITASLAEQHLTPHQLGTQRVLFIPCQWRKGLKLGGETAVENITLDGVRGLRVTLSATVHDVLYYMSPIYCQDIIDSVSNQLNKLYLKFLKRNPGYHGKVSLYGHSLGSVLSYDILCHQDNIVLSYTKDQIMLQHLEENDSLVAKNKHSSIDNLLFNVEADHSSHNADLIEEHTERGCDLVSLNVCSEEKSESSRSCMSGVDEIPKSGIISGKEREIEIGILEDIHGSRRLVVEGSDSREIKFGQGCEQISKRDCMDIRAEVEKLKMAKEIEILRARINELEDQHNSRDAGGDLQQDTIAIWNECTQKNENMAPKIPAPNIRFTKLLFKVDTFYAVGSPLGVFLALRNIRIGIGQGGDYWADENICEEMPACRHMLNIFHPFDPVAYRLEPLVCKEYMNNRPVIIPYHKGGKRLHIGFKEFTEDLAGRTKAISDFLSSVKTTVLTICHPGDSDGPEDSKDDDGREERTYGSVMMERLTGSRDGRIDHMLQDKTFEHPYLQALGSHTNYWRDLDTALFILKHLYREIPEDPNADKASFPGEKAALAFPYHRDYTVDDLPLTFYDEMRIRTFSKKAKHVMSN